MPTSEGTEADRALRRTGAALAATATAGLVGGPPAVVAAVLAAALCAAGMPLFRRYALARPNARSSHSVPTPQGGGAAIFAATLIGAALASASGALSGSWPLWLAAAATLVAVVGAIDDMRGLPVLPRLLLQAMAVAVVVLAMPGGRLLSPVIPTSAETALLVFAGLWFVNLTNFMDGIDGITLAGFLPLAAGVALAAGSGHASAGAGAVAAALLGALAGFVWFNLPRAPLFLGDVGSLPIGLVGGALLLDLALHGGLAAALILPAYHVLDATTTLLARLMRGERVWEAHRRHAYQRAVDAGWSHGRVSGLVLGLNLLLAGVAVWTLGRPPVLQAGAVGVAVAAAGGLVLLLRSAGRNR